MRLPEPEQAKAQAVVTQDSKIAKFFSGMGESDRALYGMIGAGIIFAVLFDAGVHMFKKAGPSMAALGDRLNINGRIYVALP